MGGEQAASVLATVHRDADKLDAGARPRPSRRPIRQKYEDEGNPYYATARLWDDGIIDPAQTRDVLGLAHLRGLNAPIPEHALRRVPDVMAMIRIRPGRQSRRDRPPRLPHRPAHGHPRPSRSIPRPTPTPPHVREADEAVLIGPAAGARELSGRRRRSSPRPRRPAPRRSTRATASCPRTPTSPRR